MDACSCNNNNNHNGSWSAQEEGASTTSALTISNSKTTTWRWRPPVKSWACATVFIFFPVIILSGFFMPSMDVFNFTDDSLFETTKKPEEPEKPEDLVKKLAFLHNCTNANLGQTCSNDNNYPFKHESYKSSAEVCPEYFRWIHEDLRPWKDTAITREVLERDKHLAHFRLIILDGKAYLETFKKAWQTRDVLTIWGIVQLLRLYPGKVPDLELVFQCEDLPAILKSDFQAPGVVPMPWFHFCGHDSAYDIPFPDWSYWGWPEVHVKPWELLVKGIKEGAKRKEWKDKEPYAYWKGSKYVSRKRKSLMKCQKWLFFDWNARLYHQNWEREIGKGFKHSNLEDQCNHRYNIYIEGRAWSVSQKYILACDAMTLYIKPEYYDFFTRGLIPMQHYWPIRPDNKCRDIKFAVDWGNEHTEEAQAIGENGSEFAEKQLSMKYVYDYMFHLLSEYAKLQRYKPTVPQGAVKLCSESMACVTDGLLNVYMTESLVGSPSEAPPCTLRPPYEPHQLKEFLEKNDNITRQVEKWQANYHKKH